MKKTNIMAIVLMSLCTLTTFAKIELNQVYLKIDLKNEFDVHYVAYKNKPELCMNIGRSISLENMQVVRSIDSLIDGLYSCEGEFAHVNNANIQPVQFFSIKNCQEQSIDLILKECQTINN